MIKIVFACGHTLDATGLEELPRCACGETKIDSIVARAPKFTGHAKGPCADFKNLPATPVTLGTS